MDTTVPQELVNAYTEIVKAEANPQVAAAHMVNFLIDAQKLTQAIQETVDAARQRAITAQ